MYFWHTFALIAHGGCIDKQLLEDLHERQREESKMQEELDSLKDNLRSEKQNLAAAAYDCEKFRSLCNEKDAELQVFVKCA